MKASEIRKKFLEYFKQHGHAVVPSSSLVPDDPSVLLTTAGMQQFKPYYVGKADPMRDFGSRNATSVQKCFRTSDIEEVGDRTHLTFFEMLGNFSFAAPATQECSDGGRGGYFKKEAIHYAYDFVVNTLGIDRERMYVTIFAGEHGVPEDKESFRIWHEEIGLPKERIFKHGRADNFWGPTGNEGPCGPTTEIYIAANAEDALAGNGVEIWNVVFNEYYAKPDKTLEKLESPGIDTGMGLERLAVMLQGADTVFDTDLFLPVVATIRDAHPGLDDKTVRVLADHLRSSIFLIADGVRPSNKEAGYVLRRLLRRVLVYGIIRDIHADLFPLVLTAVQQVFGNTYPEITKTNEISDVWVAEKTKFEKALALGVKEIEKYGTISAQEAFMIYETFGLPFELLQELVPAKVKGVRAEDIEAEFKKHQEISRAGAEKKFGGHGLLLDTGELKAADEEELKKVTRLHTATHLAQAALRKVLGDDVHQMGSDITAQRARFDFSFPRKLTDEEVKKVEDLVNGAVQQDLPMQYVEMPIEEAKKTGALYFFKAKYGDRVKVYFAGHDLASAFSKEFCGGPHVTHTLEVGKFKIGKQESVGAGARRIRFSVD
ncbi:MAG: alanine--tRNA ligase [Patescibacteria group bacterium]|nr:alanine--tRNA ligase [Patescibacteria group bacterium]